MLLFFFFVVVVIVSSFFSYSIGYRKGFDIGIRYSNVIDFSNSDDMTWDEAVRRVESIEIKDV